MRVRVRVRVRVRLRLRVRVRMRVCVCMRMYVSARVRVCCDMFDMCVHIMGIYYSCIGACVSILGNIITYAHIANGPCSYYQHLF